MNTQQNPSRLRRSVVAASALATSALLVFAAPVAALAHDGANSAPNVNNEYPSVIQNGSWSANLLANDGDFDGDTLTVGSYGGALHGVVNGNEDGSVVYTPLAGYVGYDTFNYTVVDQHGLTTSGEVHIDVYDDGIPDVTPPVSVADDYDVTPGGSLTVDAAAGILANDLNVVGPGWYIHAGIGPSHGTIVLDDLTGAFTYTPNAGYVGTDTVWYDIRSTIPNYPWSNGAAVTFHVVNPPVVPPTAQGETYTVTKDTAFVLSAPGVLANDSSGNGNPIVADTMSFPVHGTGAVYPDGHISYTPNAGFVGTDSVNYRVNQMKDGQPEAYSQVVTVTFLVVEDGQLPEPPVGIVPVAADDAYTTPEGQVLQVPAAGVLVNDSSDGADSIVPDTFTPPTHGMVNLLADGSLSYTPDAGFTGFDTFTYAVHAFVGGIQVATSELATVTIEVTEADEPIGLPGPQNLAPIAGDDNYAATSGVQLEVFAPGFLVNDSDPEGDAITFHLVTGAQHGTFQHLGSGWFRYTSDAGFVGADTVTYRAEEVAGDEKLSNLATITIEVTAEQLETQGVPCSPTQPGGCDEPGDEPGDESGDEPGSEISTLAYTGSDGSSWIVLASFLVIYAGGMAMRFARRHQVAVADEA